MFDQISTANINSKYQPYLARRQNWTIQLTRHALMQPGKTALRFLGHTTTWAELDDRVTRLAGALSRRGVGVGDRVLVLMLNRTEFIESLLAANKLGAIAAPRYTDSCRVRPDRDVAGDVHVVGRSPGGRCRYKHPKAIEIVDALPRTPSGKVLKTELRRRFGTRGHVDVRENWSDTTISAGHGESWAAHAAFANCSRHNPADAVHCPVGIGYSPVVSLTTRE